MKLISLGLGLLLLSTPAFAGLPPTTLGSQNGLKYTTFNFQTPKKQATKVNGATLIETGNKNILENPSFEHQSASTGWETVSNTITLGLTDSIDGNRHIEVSATAQPIEFYQDSTINATAFSDGVQGLASLWVKTALANIYVCPRNAGTRANVNQCVTVSAGNKWGLYKVPFVMGATSNGVGVYSIDSSNNALNVTGSVKVDDAFVGAQSVTTDGVHVHAQSSFYGPGGTLTGSVAITGALARSTGNGIYTYNSATGAYTFLKRAQVIASFSNGYGSTSAYALINLNGATVQADLGVASAGYSASATYSEIINAGDVLDFRQGAGSGSNAGARIAILATSAEDTTYFSTSPKDTEWQSCGHIPSDFIGFGSVTNIETQCKKDREDLLVRGRFTGGTATATEARLSLRHQGVLLTSKGSSVLANIQKAGDIAISSTTSAFERIVLIEPSVTYMTFGRSDGSFAALTKSTGTNMGGALVFSIDARIPINGWEGNLITGSFKEVPTTPGISKPKICYATYGQTGSTLAAPVAISSGTAAELQDSCGTATASFSSTGVYPTSWASGTFAPNTPVYCSCNAYSTQGIIECSTQGSGAPFGIATNSSGGFSTSAASFYVTGGFLNAWFNIKCEGQAP